ncbi:MAG: transcriptional repressor [Deltaproteobacteria bacterium]|nr:transcriptional repressor [Deltaproteobacteria bacterium]
MPAYETLLEKLRASGLKMTPQRLAILRQLADNDRHPTAQDVYDGMVAEQPTLSFATVYNALGALAEAGVCERLELGGTVLRFDPNLDPHDHAICDGCGSIRDVHADDDAPPGRAPAARAGARERKPRELTGFHVRRVERIFRGLCSACRRGGAPHDDHQPGR